jgi:hypothetical protein
LSRVVLAAPSGSLPRNGDPVGEVIVLETEQIQNSRIARGRKLFAEHGAEITYDRGAWLVPSENANTSVYEVVIGRYGEECECRDFEIRHPEGGCKHIVAATLARAKRTFVCTICGTRRFNRDRIEIGPEQVALGHGLQEGMRLCPECAGRHGAL